jgi:hypothetical protein
VDAVLFLSVENYGEALRFHTFESTVLNYVLSRQPRIYPTTLLERVGDMIRLFHLALSASPYYVEQKRSFKKVGNLMNNIARRLTVYATICTMLALALVTGAVANGSSFHGSVPPPDDGAGNIVAHGSVPPPDDGAGNIVAHGSVPPPDDGSGNIVAHGSVPPPDDGSGNIVAHGSVPPPDDGSGNIIA